MTYHQYLRTEQWAMNRRMCFERDGHRCRGCGRRDSLQAHHISYANLAAENLRLELDDLTALCPKCHAAIHGKAANDDGSQSPTQLRLAMR